jgi:HPt (histidine-containing phosphotransfer) domain-containing protein
MNKHAPYEHKQVEGFDKLANLEVCVDMEATLQQIQTQQAPHKLIIKVPKISVYSERSSSEAMGISDQQTTPKKMKVTQPTQIVDLEEEPKDQVNLDMVESGTSTVEVEKENKIQSEGSSRTFSNKKYIFDKTSESVYQSSEDLEKHYAEKGNTTMGEMRDLVPEVEKVSRHKYFMFTVRDVEKRTFNIPVADEDKVSEIKIKYDNISAPDKVKFHKHTSDMLYFDYLSLSSKNSKLSSYAMKLEGQLRQENASSRAWKTQGKRLEAEDPQGLKNSLDEKDKLIQSLKKKLKIPATENPQTTELVALEQEKETLHQETLGYKARVL